MVAETLPCAEKSCSSKMSLLEDKDNVLYYRCLEKHNEHYFRYDVAQKQWERLIVSRKLVLHFEHDPYAEPMDESSIDESIADFEIEESAIEDFDDEKSVADDLDIEKSVVDEFEESLVAPLEAPEAPTEEPVDVLQKEEPVSDDSTENVELVSDLRKIKGIGTQQLNDLQEAGVHTISDLASCSASNLSKKTGLAISQLVNWIVKAKTLTEDEQVIPA